MNENTITITREEYNNLIKAAERIAAVERLCVRSSYVGIDDVKIILDINEPAPMRVYNDPVTMGVCDGEL